MEQEFWHEHRHCMVPRLWPSHGRHFSDSSGWWKLPKQKCKRHPHSRLSLTFIKIKYEQYFVLGKSGVHLLSLYHSVKIQRLGSAKIDSSVSWMQLQTRCIQSVWRLISKLFWLHIAKLSSSWQSNWTEIALLSLLDQPPTNPPPRECYFHLTQEAEIQYAN